MKPRIPAVSYSGSTSCRWLLWGLAIFLIITPAGSVALYESTAAPKVPAPATPGQLIVKLKADVSPVPPPGKLGGNAAGLSALSVIAAKHEIRSQRLLFSETRQRSLPAQLRNVIVISIPEGADARELLQEYQHLAEVEYAHLDWPAELYEIPNDSLYTHQWALNNEGQGHYHVLRRPGAHNDSLTIAYGRIDADIDAQEVFEQPPDNTSAVVLAVIDTGVDLDHPELSDRIWTNLDEIPGNGRDDDHNGYIDDLHGWDFCGDGSQIPPVADNDPRDEHGHGTHCAGIAAAISGNGNGVAGISSDCRVMALKFYPVMLSSYAAEAIVYAADNGADVISMSFGYPWPVQLLDDALDYAQSKGVVSCAATGNDGGEYANYPAASGPVIAVGATTSSDLVTSFSTYGNHLDVVAPGLSILSLRGSGTDMYAGNSEPGVHIIEEYYYLASGTSMACPHVAGIAAYLRAVSPGLLPAVVEEIVKVTAEDLLDPYGSGQDLPGWDRYSGSGRVNLYQALAAAPPIRAVIESPAAQGFVGGQLEITGTAAGEGFQSYRVDVGAGWSPASWTEISVSSGPVVNGTLANWNTTGLDGVYTLRLRAGESHAVSRSVYVANSTLATITTPAAGDTLTGWVILEGSASCPGFSHYSVEYQEADSSDQWQLVKTASIPVVAGELAAWNLGGLPEGDYRLRLTLFAESSEVASDMKLLHVGSLFSGGSSWKVAFASALSIMPNYGDFDRDGEMEIVIGTESGLFWFNGDGTVKETGVPALPAGDFRIPVAVGDLDGDGAEDFVAAGFHGSSDSGITRLYGFCSQADPFQTDVAVVPNLRRFETIDESGYPSVFLRDIDDDGRDEIGFYAGDALPLDQPHFFMFDSDGERLFDLSPVYGGFGYSLYFTADLDGDNLDEFFVSNYQVYQVDTSGAIEHYFDLRLDPGSSFRTEGVTAVDIDRDCNLELIVFGRFIGPLGQYWIYAFDEDLSLKPGWPRRTGLDKFLVPSLPVFGDLDLDGSLDYFLTTFGLSQGRVLGWRINGTPFSGDSAYSLFAVTLQPAKLFTPIMADFDGDGRRDLAASAGPNVWLTYDVERLVGWDVDGQMLPGWPIITVPFAEDTINSSVRLLTVGDINEDGVTDLLLTTMANELALLRLGGVPFDENLVEVECWRYNRRLNGIRQLAADCENICGDVDGDGSVDLLDPIRLLGYLFSSDPEPFVSAAADVDCSGRLNLTDAVYLIAYIFWSGAAPCDACPR